MVVGGKLDNVNSSARNDGGKGEHRDSWYSPDPPIPHPHVYNRGDPPKLEESSTFAQWQSLMRTHMRSSCIELWNIIEHGLFIGDPNNLTRRQIVNSQLNATALHMIQQGLGTKVKGYFTLCYFWLTMTPWLEWTNVISSVLHRF